MADRYQNRPFPAADDYDRGDTQARAESDPLAELARLIGQTDPFGAAAKAPHPLQSRANARPHYEPMEEDETAAPAGPPPWMQRARQEPPRAAGIRRTGVPAEPGASLAPLRDPAACTRAGLSRRAQQPSRNTRSRNTLSRTTQSQRSKPPILHAMTRRSMAGSNPANMNISATRPIRTIPTPIRANTKKSPSRPSAPAAW